MPRGSSLGDVMMGLVFVALATTIVAHKDTAAIVGASGNAFSSSIKAATGS